MADESRRDWPIVSRQINWMEVTPEAEQVWAEVLTEKFHFADGERLQMLIEYAVEDGDNFFAMKICNLDLEHNYHFAEIFAADLCYPDHTLVYPTTIDPGDEVLISWWTTRHGTVMLDGADVGSNGSMRAQPSVSTDYRFEVGGEVTEYRVEVR